MVGGVARTVLEEEHYEVTEMRLVDVPVTVVEQHERGVFATVYDTQQVVRPVADLRSAALSAVAPLGFSPRGFGGGHQEQPLQLAAAHAQGGEMVDERSMVGPPGAADWRFQNRAEVSPPRARAPLRTPLGLAGHAAARDPRFDDAFETQAPTMQWYERPDQSHTPARLSANEWNGSGRREA